MLEFPQAFKSFYISENDFPFIVLFKNPFFLAKIRLLNIYIRRKQILNLQFCRLAILDNFIYFMYIFSYIISSKIPHNKINSPTSLYIKSNSNRNLRVLFITKH